MKNSVIIFSPPSWLKDHEHFLELHRKTTWQIFAKQLKHTGSDVGVQADLHMEGGNNIVSNQFGIFRR